ncbi:TonB-dependent receptor [Pseudaquabacterium terrae]|nr:TonB-dependent receptor [Aquabacterium terrae]
MPVPSARRSFIVHPLALAAALALAAPAFAQQQLQVVTVTAERRVENIRDVPSSISTLSGEALDVLNSSGQDIRQLAGRVPSLNIESSFGRAFPRFYIRGLGNTDFDLNASQPVSLVFDEVVQENPILKGFPIFDIAQIEVLRGPQGTLFGRNTTAGVVKFESVKPVLKKTEGYFSIGAGTFSSVNAEGAFNIPLSDVLAARISLQSQHRDDWVKNTYAAGPTKEMEGYDDTAGRVQFLYQPSKDFSALFNVHGRKLDGTARVFRANIFKPGTNDFVDGFDPKKVSHDGKNEQDLTSDGASLRLRWNLGAVTLHSITGYEHVEVYSRGDIDGGFGAFFLPSSGPGFIPFDAESADGLPKHRQLSQEFRVESNASGPLKWQGGVYLFDEEIRIDSFNYSSIGGNAQNGYATQNQENRAWAVFGSVNFKVSDALELRGGLRYTKDKKDFVAERFQAPPFTPEFTGRLTKETSASNVSGDLSATYALDKTTNLYGRVATGFRAPSIQGRLLFPPGNAPAEKWVSVADSEKVTSYEFGVKSDFLGGRARISAGLFHYTIKDQQVTAVGGAANFNQLVNVEKTIGKGVELDFKLLATDNLLLGLSASYNDTRIRDKNLFVDACGSGCTIRDPIIALAKPDEGKFSPTVAIDGNPLPQAPKTVVNLNARFAMPTGNGEWYVYTDWSYRSKINFFLYEAVEFTGKPLTEGGLRIGYIWGNGKYEAAVFGRNITDQVRAVGGIDFNNLTGFINDPRTWGAQFKMSF